MTEVSSSPTTWSPPATDPTISSPATASPPSWSPPSNDPVIGRSPTETPAWSPPDVDAVAGQTFSKLDSSSVQDLAKDTSFRPVDVVSQFGHIVKPEQLDKLADIERQKHENGVTAASTFEGLRGAWEGIKQLGAGAIQIAKHTPSILRVAKTGLGGDVGQKLFGGEQTPEELQADTKNAAEVLSGIEAMGAGYGSTVRGLVRNAVNKEAERSVAGLVGVPDSAFGGRMNADITRPSTFLKDVDWKQRLLDDAAIAGQHREITEAGGEVMNLLGGKEELAAQGIKVDPEVVSQLSAIEDPTLAAQFALPLLRSLSITGDAAKGFTIANGTKTVATAATKDAADNFVASVGKVIAKTGGAIEKSAKAAQIAGGMLGHSMGPIGSGIGAAGLPVAVKAAGKLVTWTGETLANPKISVPVLEAGKRAAEGAGQGALFSVPFAAAGDLPEDQISTLGAGALMGVAGATAGHAIGSAKMQAVRGVEYAVSKAFRDAPDANPTGVTPAYGTDARLDAAHAQSMAKLQQEDPKTANILNRVRNLLAGDAEVYYVPRKTFSEETGRPDDEKLPSGVHIPTSDPGSLPRILLPEGGKEAAFHEVGHVITSLMPEADKASFYDSIKENYSPEQLTAFKSDYEKSLGSKITDAQVLDEVGAELISGIIRGVPLDGTPLPIRQRALSIVGRLGESLGLYSTKSPTAPTTTGLDLPISPKAAKPAQDFVSGYLQKKTQPEPPPVISQSPVPPIIPPPVIPKATEAPVVTPAHEKVLDLLKSKVSTDEFNSWTAIKDKVQNGETLTPEEAQDWGKLDDVAQQIPPEISTVTQPSAPVNETIQPVPAPTPSAPVNETIQPVPAPTPSAPVEAAAIKTYANGRPARGEPGWTPLGASEQFGRTGETKQSPISEQIPNLRVTRKDQNAFENTPERTDIGIQEAAAAVEKGTPEQKKVFQTLREALRAPQGQVKPVEIVHGSVEPVEETPGGTRTKRRTEQEDQGQRGQYQKLIIPDGFNVTKTGKVQLRAISPDKVLSNARQIVSNKKAEALVPYEVKDGQFTDKSAQEFNDDLEQYWVNQAAGFKGDGTPLTRPENHGGFIPPENNAGQVKPIAKDKADFLNLVQGISPPKTARVNLDKLGNKIKPVNVRAFELAKANSKEPMKPGVISNKDINKQTYEDYGNQQVSEFNPLRKSLDEAGVPTRELLEATERLNLEDIKQAVSRPDNRLRAPVTDVTAAGFLPSREPVAEQAAEKLGLKFGGNLRGLWQFDVTDPKDGQPIRFAIKEGATEEQIKAKADAKLSEFAEGNGTRELNPDWRVSIHREPGIPNFPGYVQIDDISGGVNKWSKSPQTLRAEGYDVPDSLFEKVSTGRYKLGDLLEGNSEPLPQAQLRDLREKTQFQPVTTKTEKQAKGNDEVRSIAADYVREAGLPYAPHSGNQEINEPLAKRIASFYGSAKHEPTDPEVKSAYAAFVQETKDQYRHLTSEGYKMEPWTKEGQPYKNSAEMSADVRDNKHLWYFPTEGGFGTGEAKAVHPLLDDSGVKVGNKTVPVNDLFRAVHDVFGHSAEGYEFGPRGELNAFKAHAAMYSEEARPAMAAETLGQNSWVNFGEHLRDESGNIAKKGEKGFVPLTDRPFAEQKATTLPKGMVDAVMNPEEGIQFQPKPDEEKSLFHGTPVKWEKPRLGRPGVFWLTEDPKTAKEGYARGGEVKEFKTQLGNVADLTKDRSLYKKLVEIYNKDSEIKGDPDRTHRLSDADEASVINSADVLSYLKKQGYDSARVFEDRSSGETSYAVFDTKQLNRATPEFLPSKEPRAVKSAAIRDEDGNIFEGPMHVFAHMEAARANNEGPFEEGFVANNGEFLSREQAYRRGRDLGQIESGVGNPPDMPDEATRDAHHEDFQHLATEADSRKNSEFGQQFKPKRKDLKLTHFSQQENLKELDPEFHGTGLLGAERKRAANYPRLYPKRSYFGLPGYEKEQGLGNNRYSASVPKDSVYDFQADPDNLYPSSAEIEKAGYAPMDNGAKTTLYEKRIKDAGYKGYLNKAAKAVAMFDKTPVKSEGLQFQPGRAGLSINASDIQAKRAETAWKEEGTDSPFFKRWFGDSVIADKKGEPKLVYHGTSVPKDFDVFKAKEIGFHFGTKEQANEILERREYQSGDSENQRVIPVYLRVENPLRVEDEGSWTAQRVQYALRGLDGFSNEEVKSATTLEKLRTLIESKGYDGLVYKNAGEVKGLTELQKKLDAGKASQAEFEKLQVTGDDSYIVWHPEQVKSAFNRGTFDNEALAMQFLPVTKTASSKSVPNEDIQPATKTGTLGASNSKKEDFQSVGK